MNWGELARPKALPIGSPLFEKLMDSDEWVAQEKKDGVRCLVTVFNGRTTGVSRHGKALNVPDLGLPDMQLDCELMGDRLWVFDRTDIPDRPLSQRLMRLPDSGVARSMPMVRVDKRRFLDDILGGGGEGIVLKSLKDYYPPLNGAAWFKVKEGL